MCQNRFRTCSLQLRITHLGIGVFAARSIDPGTVVCQYWGTYVLSKQFDEAYTIKLNARDAGGRQVFVSAEHGGSKARFIAHACKLNTEYVERRGLRRVVISLVYQSAIKTGDEITADYIERTVVPLWCH